MWERGLAPAGFLVLLFTLFLSQFSLPDSVVGPRHPQRAASEGGVAPSPLTAAADGTVKKHQGLSDRTKANETRMKEIAELQKHIGAYRKTPQKVVGGGVDFMPCVCLADDPAGPLRPAAAALRLLSHAITSA